MIVSYYLPTRVPKQVWDCRAGRLLARVISVDTSTARIEMFDPLIGRRVEQRTKIIYLEDQQLVLVDPLDSEEMSPKVQHAQIA